MLKKFGLKYLIRDIHESKKIDWQNPCTETCPHQMITNKGDDYSTSKNYPTKVDWNMRLTLKNKLVLQTKYAYLSSFQ